MVKGLRQNHQLHLPSGRLGKAGRGQSGLRTNLSVLPQLVARVLFHPTSSSFPFTSTPFPPTLFFIWRSPPPFPSFPSSHPLDLIVPFCCLQARSLKGVRHLMSLIPILCRWDGVRDTHTHTHALAGQQRAHLSPHLPDLLNPNSCPRFNITLGDIWQGAGRESRVLVHHGAHQSSGVTTGILAGLTSGPTTDG